MVRQLLVRGLCFALVTAIIPACGGGGGGGGGGGSSFSVSSAPGSASGSATAGAASAGLAGSFLAYSRGDIHFGQVSPPPVPTLPTPPTTGTVVTTAILAAPPANFGADGNLLINGAVTTPGTGIIGIAATRGDIVVSGSLQSSGAAAPDTIVLSAPVGTVYITGSVRTTLGKTAGANGGALLVQARRIIVTGSIDTSADSNAAGDGGRGGVVSFDTTGAAGGTSIYALGSIHTSGGTGTTRSASGKSDAGTIFITANNEAWLEGSVTGLGGAVNGNAGALTSGNGAQIQIDGSAGAFINSSINVSAGSVTTTGTGTGNGALGTAFYASAFTGGTGGLLFVNVFGGGITNPSGPVYVFGSFTANGGAASAASGTLAAPIFAGDSGEIQIGNPSAVGAPASVNFGVAGISLPGANSSDNASQGGFVVLRNDYAGAAPIAGDIVFTGSIDLSNGNGGNRITVGGAPQVSIISINGDVFLSGSMNLGGGTASGSLGGTFGGAVAVISGSAGTRGGIFSSASITANGQNSSGNTGGDGGQVSFRVLDTTSGLSLLPGTVIAANGGSGGGAAGAGGGGGVVGLATAGTGGAGTISVFGTITAVGGNAGSIGGLGGRLVVDSNTSGGVGGDVRLENGTLITLSGGNGTVGGSARNNGGGATTATRVFDNLTTCCLEIWTHGTGTAPAEPGFPVAGGGRLINNGFVRADGGSSGGNGGDMNIDAFQSDGSAAVTVGTIGSVSNIGNGGGLTGAVTVH